MNADEIVKTLQAQFDKMRGAYEVMSALAEVRKEEIESLQAQLAASQRSERAAVEDLERYGRNIHTCDKATACTIVGQDHAACYDCPDWIWRGAQA